MNQFNTKIVASGKQKIEFNHSAASVRDAMRCAAQASLPFGSAQAAVFIYDKTSNDMWQGKYSCNGIRYQREHLFHNTPWQTHEFVMV